MQPLFADQASRVLYVTPNILSSLLLAPFSQLAAVAPFAFQHVKRLSHDISDGIQAAHFVPHLVVPVIPGRPCLTGTPLPAFRTTKEALVL